MRRILVEKARQRKSLKLGGHLQRVDLDDACDNVEIPFDDLLSLDEALTKLAFEDPQKAKLVELRYFAGFSEEAAAEMLGISRATASRHWSYAKAYLFCAVTGSEKEAGDSEGRKKS